MYVSSREPGDTDVRSSLNLSCLDGLDPLLQSISPSIALALTSIQVLSPLNSTSSIAVAP